MKNIFKKFRSLFITLVTTLLLVTSCETLDEVPESFISPENFYKTVPQCETALATAIGSLWNEWYGSSYAYSYNLFRNDDQLLGGDLIYPSNHGRDLWFTHYCALLNINAVLKSIKAGNVEASESEINLLAAQAKFLRAFNYFVLVQLWGDVPLYTEDLEDPALNPIARTSSKVVYDLIISDFKFAAQYLPPAWSADKQGRMDKYTAKGFLAKVYLTMAGAPLNLTENYAKARDEAKSIMDAGDCPYDLMQDVHDVFKKENKYQKEIMFSYHSTEDDKCTSANIWGPWEIGGWWDYPGDPRVDSIWPEQPRKEAYLLTEIFHDGKIKHYKEWWYPVVGNKKYQMPYISQTEWDTYATTANFAVFRYPEVLLIFAEADNLANGKPSQAAVDAINQVIDRANGWMENPAAPLLTTSMSKEEFDKAVIHERDLEFFMEYPNRYLDLLRKRMLEQVNKGYSFNFTPDDYLFPIPEEDLKQNPLLKQNPGYAIGK